MSMAVLLYINIDKLGCSFKMPLPLNTLCHTLNFVLFQGTDEWYRISSTCISGPGIHGQSKRHSTPGFP